MLGYSMTGEWPEWKDLLALFPEGVGIFLAPLEEIYCGCLQKPDQLAFHLLLFLSSYWSVLCLQLSCKRSLAGRRDCSLLGWGCCCSEGSLQFFPSVNFTVGGRQNVPCIRQVPSEALPS